MCVEAAYLQHTDSDGHNVLSAPCPTKTFTIIFICLVVAETKESLVISKCHIISQRTNNREHPSCHLSRVMPSMAQMLTYLVIPVHILYPIPFYPHGEPASSIW